jgi:penicillin amidase
MCFIRNLIFDELGPDLYKDFIDSKVLVRNVVKNSWLNQNSEWYDNISTSGKETYKDIVNKSFKDALDSLKLKLGANPVNWHWGNIHTLSLNHPLGKVWALDFAFNLNRGPYPVGGSFHTVSPYGYEYDDLFKADHGASERHIFSTANWDESLTIIPTGISGIPASPYYCDQTEMYINNEYHADYIDMRKIELNTKFRLTILPVK